MDAHLAMDNVIVFKKIIEIINELIDHVTIVCTKSRLEISLITLDMAAMASISLMVDSFFTSYRIKEEIINLHVHVGELCKILKNAVKLNGWETLRIKLEKPDSDFISFILLKTKDTFKMRLLDIQGQNFINGEAPVDWEIFNYKIEMPSKDFIDTCNVIDQFGEVMCISAHKNILSLYSVSDGDVALSNFCKRYTFENCIDLRNEIKSNFSAKYMKKFSLFSSLSETVVFRFQLEHDSNFPILLCYSCPSYTFDIHLLLGSKYD